MIIKIIILNIYDILVSDNINKNINIDINFDFNFNKPDNVIKERDGIYIQGIKKEQYNVIDERDGIHIEGKEKEPSQNEYIDELLLEGERMPDNEIQLIDQMEILKVSKLENAIEYIDTIEIIYQERIWTTIPSYVNKLTIFRQVKPEIQLIYTDKFIILNQERPPNIVDKMDSILIPGKDIPNSESQDYKNNFIYNSNKK